MLQEKCPHCKGIEGYTIRAIQEIEVQFTWEHILICESDWKEKKLYKMGECVECGKQFRLAHAR